MAENFQSLGEALAHLREVDAMTASLVSLAVPDPATAEPAPAAGLEANQPASSRPRFRHSGLLAGLLAAGVSNLLASNPKATVEMAQLASKSVANLLASKPDSAIELTQLAGWLAPLDRYLPASETPENSGTIRQRAAGKARAASQTPERRREIAMLGVAARNAKRSEQHSGTRP